jgi:hypothetical protein
MREYFSCQSEPEDSPLALSTVPMMKKYCTFPSNLPESPLAHQCFVEISNLYTIIDTDCKQKFCFIGFPHVGLSTQVTNMLVLKQDSLVVVRHSLHYLLCFEAFLHS